jgi:hypothetical protein
VVALIDNNIPARLQERRFMVVERGDGAKSVGWSFRRKSFAKCQSSTDDGRHP